MAVSLPTPALAKNGGTVGAMQSLEGLRYDGEKQKGHGMKEISVVRSFHGWTYVIGVSKSLDGAGWGVFINDISGPDGQRMDDIDDTDSSYESPTEAIACANSLIRDEIQRAASPNDD